VLRCEALLPFLNARFGIKHMQESRNVYEGEQAIFVCRRRT
jgi:hypothetical protein